MNTGYAGMAMCLPHVYNEIHARIEGNEDNQSVYIDRHLDALIKATKSLSNDTMDLVKIHHPETNHTEYVSSRSAMNHIQVIVGRLLQHVCVIGETAADLLGQMYGYAALYDKENELSDVSIYIVHQVSELRRQTHRRQERA